MMRHIFQTVAFLFWGGLCIFCALAQENPISSDFVQQLVEASRTKSFTSKLPQDDNGKVEVYRLRDDAGNMLERRDYYDGNQNFILRSFRLPEGYFFMGNNGKIVKNELGGNIKEEECPALAWDWAWNAILRNMKGECSFQSKNLSSNGKKILQITVNTPVTAENLASIDGKTAAEVQEKLPKYQKIFPSMKQLFIDEEQNFILRAVMYNAEGKKLIDVNWGKVNFTPPKADLLSLPDIDKKIPVAKTVEDIANAENISRQASSDFSLGKFFQDNLFWILIGFACIAFAGAIVIARKNRR